MRVSSMGVSGPLRNRGTGKQALFLRHFLPKMTKSHADFEWNFTAIPLDPLLGYLVDIPWNSLDVLHGFLRLFFVFSGLALALALDFPSFSLPFPSDFPPNSPFSSQISLCPRPPFVRSCTLAQRQKKRSTRSLFSRSIGSL